MYADRYAKPTRFNPGGLTAAIAINAALVAALMFAGPKILPEGPDHVLVIGNIPLDPPPPPPIPEVKPAETAPHHATETILAPVPEISVPTNPTDLALTTIPTPPAPTKIIGTDPGPAVEAPAPPAPLPFVGPSIDSRYADAFQPDYPAVERRANRDGRVTVRVLVGVDGRVKQIEQVSATSDAFWRTTQERALKAWRFKPATRGNVPVEAWRTMTLTFRMEDAG